MIQPGDFEWITKEWITALFNCLNDLIVKLGVIVAAAYGLAKIVKSKEQELRATELNERLDRQSERIDNVALSVPPPPVVASAESPMPVTVVNPQSDPVQTHDADTPVPAKVEIVGDVAVTNAPDK